jgi:Fungal specific transcription factor domain
LLEPDSSQETERRESTSSGSSLELQNASDEEVEEMEQDQDQDQDQAIPVANCSNAVMRQSRPPIAFETFEISHHVLDSVMPVSSPELFHLDPKAVPAIASTSPVVAVGFSQVPPNAVLNAPSKGIPRQISHSSTPSHPESFNFFLDYYVHNVRQYHYFLYSDHEELATKGLLSMAESSDALRHAIVAFSALIYSMKVPGNWRHFAFAYYESALKGLRELLNKFPMGNDECLIAVATALQLSTLDVHPLPARLKAAPIWRRVEVLSTHSGRSKDSPTRHYCTGNVRNVAWQGIARVVHYFGRLHLLPRSIYTAVALFVA